MFVFFCGEGARGAKSRSRRPNEKNAKKREQKKKQQLSKPFLPSKGVIPIAFGFTTPRVIKTTQTNDTHGRRDASKEEKRYGARLRREKRAFRDALLRRVLRSLPFETQNSGDSPPSDLNSSLGRRRSSRFCRASRKD